MMFQYFLIFEYFSIVITILLAANSTYFSIKCTHLAPKDLTYGLNLVPWNHLGRLLARLYSPLGPSGEVSWTLFRPLWTLWDLFSLIY